MDNYIEKTAMKSKIILTLLSVILTATIYSQQSRTDSINSVKQQQRIEEITKRLADRKEKLVQLEKEFIEKTNSKERAGTEAQESADKNRQAADRLSDDAQDKKKARRAEKQSDDARRDAKKARRASNNLEEIEDDIRQLTKRIAEDEKKLADLQLQKSKQ